MTNSYPEDIDHPVSVRARIIVENNPEILTVPENTAPEINPLKLEIKNLQRKIMNFEKQLQDLQKKQAQIDIPSSETVNSKTGFRHRIYSWFGLWKSRRGNSREPV